MVLPKLALSNFLNRKSRVVLTVLAIAMSVSLVVSVTSGYTSIEAAAYKFFTHYVGSIDATVTNKNYASGVPETLIDQFKADPRVRNAFGRYDTETIFPAPPAFSNCSMASTPLAAVRISVAISPSAVTQKLRRSGSSSTTITTNFRCGICRRARPSP